MVRHVQLNYVSKCSAHLQGMTYNLLQHEEETREASKQNSQVTVRVSIGEERGHLENQVCLRATFPKIYENEMNR